MDQTGAALVAAVEPYGLMPLLFVGAGIAVVVVLCAFVFPAWKKNNDAKMEIMRAESDHRMEMDRIREERKAKESDSQAERERERARLDSQNAVLLEGLKTSIDVLVANQEHVNAEIKASRTGSQKMGVTVEDTNRKVTEIHHALIG